VYCRLAIPSDDPATGPDPNRDAILRYSRGAQTVQVPAQKPWTGTLIGDLSLSTSIPAMPHARISPTCQETFGDGESGYARAHKALR
jgi:hypothetical protein